MADEKIKTKTESKSKTKSKVKFSIEVSEDKVILILPVEKILKPSHTGKSLVIATTHGPRTTTALVNDKVVWAGANVFIKNG